MTIITDPLFYVLAVPAVIALGLSKGGFAGMGQMATPLLAVMMPPLEAAAIFLPIMILQDATAMWVYRKDWNGRILVIVLPGVLVGVALAGLLAAQISSDAVRLFTGIATFSFAVYSWTGAWLAATAARADARPPGTAAGVIAGVASGFASTLCQLGGPPYQIYAVAQKLPKMTFVGTSAIFFGVMNWAKVPPYIALDQFSAKGLATSLVLVPLAIAANQLGFWAVRRVSQEMFYRITLIMMFLISLELMRAGALGMLRS